MESKDLSDKPHPEAGELDITTFSKSESRVAPRVLNSTQGNVHIYLAVMES